MFLQHAFRRVDRIVGHSQWSQFGLAVAAAGDLNNDGINGSSFWCCKYANFGTDFVVGAPYDGKNRKGAVYVYHGSKDGIIKEHSQVGDFLIEYESINNCLGHLRRGDLKQCRHVRLFVRVGRLRH